MEDEGGDLGGSLNNAKVFLYQWLGKLKVVPNYAVRPAGLKNRMRFLCELKVEGFPYTAVGNSTNKKDAQTNAARDFIQYLIRGGRLRAEDVPAEVVGFTPSAPPLPQQQQEFPSSSGFQVGPQGAQMFERGKGPGDVGDVYRRRDGQVPFHIKDALNVADAEDFDMNANIHGNWTIENAKSRLHQYMQMNRINADYAYAVVGPGHMRSFRAEIGFYVRDLGRRIQASETGSTKQSASKSAALSLVRQLYHLGVIEAFTGSLKKAEKDAMKPYNVSVDATLMHNVQSVLKELSVIPKELPKETMATAATSGDTSGEVKPVGNTISLLPETHKREVKYDGAEAGKNEGIISWSPPVPNWNPWTNCNIDEGYMSTANLDQLSNDFLLEHRERMQTSEHVQTLMAERVKLPAFEKRVEILEAISEHPVVLIKGETGCGKTTQVCQFILDEYITSEQGAYCNVIVTQPRRISAISIAERIASERGEDPGCTVGYSVRFESCLPRPYASVLFCTVGVLLRKLEAGLRGISHVLVDEIHERDINTDVLLVVLRDMMAIYPDLRIVLMSASIDISLFTKYFNSCPVIQIEGRVFPVDSYYLEDVIETIHYKPSQDYLKRMKRKLKEGAEFVNAEDNMNVLPQGSEYSADTFQVMSQLQEDDNFELILCLLRHIRGMNIQGSILIFLPGWSVIFGLLKYLENDQLFGSSGYRLLPLHSQLPRQDQHKVFEHVPQHVTKIILSTNIAETSITIDDVVFVIDSCKAKIKLFTSHNNMISYCTAWASKSNLMQRKGRAGRVQKGICYHLCSRRRFESLDENMVPEMLRSPLHEIALNIKLLRLGGIGHFLSKAPDPPAIDAVIESQVLLTELNCLDEKSELTPLGTILAKLPIDPRYGKMLLLATIFNCADPIAVIAAQASNLSEFFNLGHDRKSLSPVQRSFGGHRFSDHMAMLNAFQQWEYHRDKGESEEFEFCSRSMLSFSSLRVTSDAKNQLLSILINQCGFPEEQLMPFKIKFRENPPVLGVIGASLCKGFYPNICYHKEKRKVLTEEAKSALIHKASINFSRFDVTFPHPFFVFGEKVRTRVITCKQTTMVSPITLLLFGAKKVDYVDGVVRLDDWINLQMNATHASEIVALRSPIENLITRVSQNPEAFFPLDGVDLRLVNVVTELSRMTYTANDDYHQQVMEPVEPSDYSEKPPLPDYPDEADSNYDDNGSGSHGIKRANSDSVDGNNFIPFKRPNYGESSRFMNPLSRGVFPSRTPHQHMQARGQGGWIFNEGPRIGVRNASPHGQGWTPRGRGGWRGSDWRGGFRGRSRPPRY